MPFSSGLRSSQNAGTVLSHDEARGFYDRFGSRQDRQAFYEDTALRELVAHGGFGEAAAVLEFGCGTGRFARELLSGYLPADATYVGFDISSTMVELASKRLASFGPRVEVRKSDGVPRLPVETEGFDRVVSNYVLDLLSEGDIEAFLHEAWRVLREGGLLCVTGLTRGSKPLSRAVSWIWSRVHTLRPSLVGGCRPLVVAPLLPNDAWRVRHHQVVVSWGIASEVLVAERVNREEGVRSA